MIKSADFSKFYLESQLSNYGEQMRLTKLIAILTAFFITTQVTTQEKVLFYDNFDDMSGWKYIKQPLVRNETKYEIVKDADNSILKCTATKNSASSLQSIYDFNVYEYPNLEWSWKIDNILSKGDVTKKSGDDYPIRIYINFKYDKETADPGYTFRYNFVKNTYGLEIPQKSLCYIIESKEQEYEIYNNPFDPKNSKMIIKHSGEKDIGKWFSENVNIVEDYKKAFGEPPLKMAYIGIMVDTDNTKESVVSYVDKIRVYAR